MRDFLKNNFILKIFAILAAFLLWIFVINEGFRVDYLEQEISIKTYNLREDVALANDLGKVKLKVRAPQDLWQELSTESIEAYVDLKNFEPGVYDVEVKVSSQDPKIQIMERNPEKVRVVLEFQSSIKKEVSVEIKGKPAEGFYAGMANLSQNEIEIRGAKSILDKIDKILAIVELNSESVEVKKNIDLVAVDVDNNKINNILLNPQAIEITVPILQENEVKSVGVKPKIIGTLSSGLFIDKIEINPQAVNIYGQKEEISNIDYIDTQEINVSGFTNTKELEAGLNLPLNVEKVEPSKVKIKIIISSSKTNKTFEAPISFKNLNSKLKIDSYDPQNISLTLEGDNDVLNSLSNKSISVNINLLGKEAKSYNINITSDMISLPESVSLKEINTKEIKINISEKNN